MEDFKNLDNSIEDKKISIENFKPTENNQDLKTLPKLRRQSNNSTSSLATTTTSDNGENVQSCGSVCVFNLQQKLIFNCEFCDLKYGDLDNFRRHLHDAHNLFQHEEELEKENGGNARKSSIISTIVKKEPLEPPIDLPPSYFTEPLVSCGNAFILNQEKFLLACGYCDCSKYDKLEMFEKHIKQQHNILEGSHNELNVVPKVEVKEELFVITEMEEAAEIKQNFSEEEGEDESDESEDDENEDDENEFIAEGDEDEFIAEEDEDDDDDDGEDEEDEEESEDAQSTSKKLKRERKLSSPMPSTSSSNKDKKTKKRQDEPDVETSNNDESEQGFRNKPCFKCTLCPKTFRSRFVFTVHQRIHTGETPFECDICHKRFRANQNLTMHKKRHMGEAGRIYSCEYCDKKFIRNTELSTHKRIHTGEKPYECQVCHKRFRANQNLTNHKKTHMGEVLKVLKCEHCDKSFKRNIDRKIHMRTHTGEKPFQCDMCSRGYASKFNMDNHIKRDHISTSPRERKKPGPKRQSLREEVKQQKKLVEELKQKLKQPQPMSLMEELEMQKKIIEELKQKLMQQMKSEES